MEPLMSRTIKDQKTRKELYRILREKRGGVHKQKKWTICPKCKGTGGEIRNECSNCMGEGIILT